MAPNIKKVANIATVVAAAVAAGKALKPHVETIVAKVRRNKATNTSDRPVQNVSFRDDNEDDAGKA